MASCHCVALATIADGDQEVIFCKGSTFTSCQNAEGLRRLQLLKSIKPRNHEEILLSTKSCYSHGRKMQETDRKMAAFVYGREERSRIMLMYAVIIWSRVK